MNLLKKGLGLCAAVALMASQGIAQDRTTTTPYSETSSYEHSRMDDYNGWYGGLAAGYLFSEGDEEYEQGQSYELRAGYDFNDKWSVEGGVGFLPFMYERDFEGGRYDPERDASGVIFRLDALYHFMQAGERGWDPYASIGGLYIVRDRPDEHGEGDPIPNVGFGTFYNFDNGWYLKPEYHLAVVNGDTELNHHALLSAGYRFGGTRGAGAASGDGDTNQFDAAGQRLEPIYFAFDSSDLSQSSRGTLKRNSDFLKSNGSSSVTIEGHCDERGTNEYNLALGQRRANSAQQYLRTLGVEQGRMSTVSYGEERPADPGHSEAAWSKNRRAEFLVRGR